MFDFEWPYYIVLFILFAVIYKIMGPEKKNWLIHSIFFVYLVGIISVTFFPFPIQKEEIEWGQVNHYLSNNFIPLKSTAEIISNGMSQVILRQIGGNIILLLPLGFFLPLFWKEKLTFAKAISLGFLSSLAIETTQLLISTIIGYTYKIFDVDDLILNTIGFVLGYGCFKAYKMSRKTDH